MSTKSYPQWRKIILVPCWGLQLLLELINILLLGLTIVYVNRHSGDLSDYEKRVGRIAAPINLLVMLLCTFLTSSEILLFLFKKLHPYPFLLMNGIKTGIWTVLWLVAVIIAVLNRGGRYYRGHATVSSFLLLGFWIPLAYSAKEYRLSKHRPSLEANDVTLDPTYAPSQPYDKENIQQPMNGAVAPGTAGPQIQSTYTPPIPIVVGVAANQSYYGAPPENYGVAGNAYRGVDGEERAPLTGQVGGNGGVVSAFRDDVSAGVRGEGYEMGNRREMK